METTYEDGTSTKNSYSADGNLITYTNTVGAVTTYQYDKNNNLIQKTDGAGNTTSYVYDAMNRVKEERDALGNTNFFAYDKDGRIIQTVDKNGNETKYDLDGNGNILCQTDALGHPSYFEYDEMNRLTKITLYAGEEEDGNGHTSLTGEQVTGYTWDSVGNLSSISYPQNQGTAEYTYDSLNRLVKEYEHGTALTILYGYDSLENKTYEKNSTDEKFYTYNEWNQLVSKEAYNRTTSYEYDKRGNRILETSVNTQENRRTYEWDAMNHLVKGTRGPDYGMYTSEYTYNGFGQRINSTIMGPDKTVYERDYVIDYTSPEHNDLAEYNVGHYQWQGDKKVHDMTNLYNMQGQRLQTESIRYVEWAGAQKYVRYIHEDIMGSSIYYTNPETGYITNKHEYTTWGNNTKAPTYNYDPEYRVSEPYFTGHPYDGSLNLYYAENRFYDPEKGSFLSSDPVQSGLNWYQYCGSNPTTYVDPLGLFATTIAGMKKFSK